MFEELKIEDLSFNPFTKLKNDWCLIAAGDKDNYNVMTASWGGFGILWNEEVLTIYVRPSRYTNSFLTNNDYFTISFLDDHKKELAYIGSVSGKDVDKISKVNFNPIFEENGIYFKESKLVFVVEKIHHQPLTNVQKDYKKNYESDDCHIIYIGKIKKILKKV